MLVDLLAATVAAIVSPAPVSATDPCLCKWWRETAGLELTLAELRSEGCPCGGQVKEDCLACIESWAAIQRDRFLWELRTCLGKPWFQPPVFSWASYPSDCDPIVIYPSESPDCGCQ